MTIDGESTSWRVPRQSNCDADKWHPTIKPPDNGGDDVTNRPLAATFDHYTGKPTGQQRRDWPNNARLGIHRIFPRPQTNLTPD